MTNPKTTLIQTGRSKEWTNHLVNTPVMRASTCLFDNYADLRAGVKTALKKDRPFYGRMGTPSQWSLREAISALEGAYDTYLFPSGVAAISCSILALVSAGERVLLPDTVYEPIRATARKLLARFGIDHCYYDPLQTGQLEDLMDARTKLILVESPGSLTFEIQDLPAITKIAKKWGAYTLVDNSWATPLYHNPLNLGADIVVHAGTKYLSGHSDVMVGSASANKRSWPLLEQASFAMGQTLSPDDAYLTLRGIRSLAARLALHRDNTEQVLKAIDGHPSLAKILYPARADCPGHSIWQRDFTGATGLFSIVLKGGSEPDCAPFVDHLKHFKMGFSWGGFESLILPQDPRAIRTVTSWQAEGPLLRLHIGLEDPKDLIPDLLAGLDRYRAGPS